jgi:rare lipoprotein A
LKGAARLPAAILLVFGLIGAVACASRQPAVPGRPLAPVEAAPSWFEEGIASWYGGGDGFDGKPTASGEIYDAALLTAAHRELALGTVVDVLRVDTGESVRVRINDRGPFVKGRVVDLSKAAAEKLGLIGPGTGRVRISVVAAGAEPPVFNLSGRWAVQIGSFADRQRAERHAERVRATGRSVYLEPYRGLSRVKVGNFGSRREAQETLESLEKDGFEGIVVPGS